ncbi:hypothetical protein [Clostridium akagii]|uniref:glycan biosynthesis hexose transferase WsfD n=1 Tax=Clostridium akagii TaxID=91623 RepID=UPI00047BC2C2|nr:hypothetical protein [Clostridium akagii]
MSWIIEKIKNYKYLIQIFVLIIIGAILLNTLFIYPILGKCDNGDFERLTYYGGLSNLHSQYHKIYDGFIHLQYSITSPSLLDPFNTDWVSGAILLKVAVFISLFVHNFHNSLFDIRYFAFVYSLVFLMAIFLIMNFKKFSPISKLTAGIFIILFFTDTSYLEYFNSFYGEAGTIVFFFLCIGTYLNLIGKEEPQIRQFICFFIASACFLTSKSQELPLLIFMLIIYAALFIYYKGRSQRKCIAIASVLVIALCGASYFSLTNTMNDNNLYQSVFAGVLRDSKTPEKDLKELGINKKFLVFDNHSFYNKDGGNDPMGAEMKNEFYPNVSPIKVLGFYFNHLDRLWQKVVDSADNAYGFSLPGPWNFMKGQYTHKKIINTFRTNLIKKYPYVHRNIYGFISFSIIYLGIVVFYFIRNKDKGTRLLTLMLLFILAAGSSQLILPVIGSGHGDFEKHLFLLNLSYDIMLGISVIWFVHCISKFVKLLKKFIVVKSQ